MKNNLIRGIRKASDFLMALQLTGAFKRDSLANLQVQLPAIVIGGGLTGIDTATELLAYYPVQVEKTLERHEQLVRGRSARRPSCAQLDAEEQRHLRRPSWSTAARCAPSAQRARPRAATPDFIKLVRSWGGVTPRATAAASPSRPPTASTTRRWRRRWRRASASSSA